MIEVRIDIAGLRLNAVLWENPTAHAIQQALPLLGKLRRWGGQLHFGIPVHLDPSPDARTVVQAGDLAYWSAGRAFCLFFGATPASEGEEPRAAGPVNVFGRIQKGAERLDDVEDDAVIRVREL